MIHPMDVPTDEEEARGQFDGLRNFRGEYDRHVAVATQILKQTRKGEELVSMGFSLHQDLHRRLYVLLHTGRSSHKITTVALIPPEDLV